LYIGVDQFTHPLAYLRYVPGRFSGVRVRVRVPV
jgi:hypothetical protein